MAVEIKAEDPEEGSKDSEAKKRRPRPRFRRPRKDVSNPPDPTSNAPESPSNSNSEKPEAKKEKVKKCKYFKATGKCRFGEKCKFLHVPKTEAEEDTKEKKQQDVEEPHILMPTEEAKVILPSQSVSRKFEPVRPIKLVLDSSQKGTPEQKKARETEINYFKRRFLGTKVTEISGGGSEVTFIYTASDPEWVFDVKTVTFVLALSPDHPIDLAKIDIEQGPMPWPLLQLLIRNFNEILQKKYEQDVALNSFEPIGKWFIRQVDQNLLNFFISGLKRTRVIQSAEACGIKVTVFEKPKEEERKLTTLEEISKKNEEKKENLQEKQETEEVEGFGELQENPKVNVVQKDSRNPQESSKIEICANWQDLEQSIGTITFTHFSGATRCIRCSTQEFFDVDVGKEQVLPCKKCSSRQSIKVVSVLGHQNSNVFGEIYPVGCKPTDLILQSSKLSVTCLNCSKELLVEALPYGSPNIAWCRQCNTKFRFVVHSFSFRGLTSAIPRGELIKGAKGPKKKPVKDEFIINQGQPLPKNGTCKHYGKSFRWFRFPCCGKLYPCDVCHDEVEKDHEMKFANRMVCGFCSTEQPFSKESCSFCKGSVTKTGSAFWEGGKGCRDQKKMCRNDTKKYKNTDAKTIPKKRTGQVVKNKVEKS